MSLIRRASRLVLVWTLALAGAACAQDAREGALPSMSAALLDDDRLLVQPWLGGDAHLWLVLDAPAEEVMAD